MSTGTRNSNLIKSFPTWKKNLIGLSFAQFVSMVGMSFFLPFIPLYVRELGITDQSAVSTWSGLLFSAGFLMLSLVAPLWGSLADRWGRKIMVIRAMTAASLILFLTAFVQTPQQLLFLRLLHGCFSGFVSSSVALIASETPERSLSFSLGLFQSTLTAGFIVGPFIGGLMQDNVGIRPAIFLGGLFILVGTCLVFILVNEKNKPVEKKRYSIWQNASFLFRNETLFPAARIQFLSNFSLMAIIPLLALLVVSMSAADSGRIGTMSGLVISAAALSMMLGAPYWGRMADKWGQKKVLTLCLLAAGLSYIPQAIAQTVPQLIFGRFLLGFFTAGIAPSLQALIAHHSPKERRAGILGVSFSITLMGNAIGPLMGGVLAATIGLRFPFLVTMFILLWTGYLSTKLKTKLIKAPPSTLTQAD